MNDVSMSEEAHCIRACWNRFFKRYCQQTMSDWA